MAAPTALSRPLPALGLVALLIAADQAIKLWVENALPLRQPVEVMPMLALFRTYNEGIAFSFLAGLGQIDLRHGHHRHAEEDPQQLAPEEIERGHLHRPARITVGGGGRGGLTRGGRNGGNRRCGFAGVLEGSGRAAGEEGCSDEKQWRK